MEVLKPLVVLALFGMILYGAYSVVQKGPSSEPANPAGHDVASVDAPPFVPPDVQVAAPQQPPASQNRTTEQVATSPAPAIAEPQTDPGTTYLAAESAPPPSADQLAPRLSNGQPPVVDSTAIAGPATLQDQPPASPPLIPSATLPVDPPARLADNAGELAAAPATAIGNGSSAAFTSAWTEAHNLLSAGRYAEALTALSVWYDDPALGLEESQQLEDLLGQLAGTVIYSQQDLLLPPHVAAPGDTLAAIAGPLQVSPELLAKINGIDDPQRLIPGEHIKLIRGPFDAVVSVSRRRISLQLNGAYAGSFPAVVGRRYLEKVGASLPVVDLQRGLAAQAAIPAGTASIRKAIILGEGLVIEAAEDPSAVADTAPQTSIVVAVRDLDELLDMLGAGSRVLVRQ